MLRQKLLPVLAAAASCWAAGACAAPEEAPAPTLSLGEIEMMKGPGTGEPHLFAAPDGRVHLTWLEPLEDGSHALRLSTRAGGTWSSPRTVRTSDRMFVNWADFPSSVEMADGTIAAHWLEKVADGPYAYHVMLALSDDGGETWGEPFRAHEDDSPTEHGFVAMVPWSTGAAIVWLDARAMWDPETGTATHAAPGHENVGGAMSVRFRTLAPDGALGPEVLLDDRTCECCQTALARGEEGLIAAYRDRGVDEVRDIAVVRGVGETWSEPSHVSRDGWVITGCPVNGPQLSADGMDVTVAWYTGVDGDPRVYTAFSDDGGASFGPRLRVDEGVPLGRVDVERLDDGSAVVVWLEASEGPARVLARRVAPDGGAGPTLVVSETSGERASGFPRMARSGNELILAWTLPGEGGGVRVRSLRLSD